MRFTQQPWNSIVARLELVVAGIGQPGLTPTVAIQRLDDSLWLQAGGGSWGAGYATNFITQIDAANQPGMYEYSVLAAQLDYGLSLKGYRCQYIEATIPVLEYEYIEAKPEFNGQVGAGYATAGTGNSVTLDAWAPGIVRFFSDMLVSIVNGMGKGQTRRITGYTVGRVCTVVPDWGTNPDATSLCVVHAGGAADVGAWIGDAPNALIGGRVDVDVGEVQPGLRDAVIDFIWDETLAGHVGSDTTGGALNELLTLVGSTVLAAGTVASTTGTTTTLDVGAVATEGYYVDAKIVIGGGPGVGQERVITGYTAGRVATHAAWTTDPDATSKYVVAPGLPSPLAIMAASMSSYETAGTFGNHINRILRLRQENMRVVYTTWSTHGQPTAGYVLVYASSADLTTDVDPWALAKGRYDFTATYDVDLQLTGYQSARTL